MHGVKRNGRTPSAICTGHRCINPCSFPAGVRPAFSTTLRRVCEPLSFEEVLLTCCEDEFRSAALALDFNVAACHGPTLRARGMTVLDFIEEFGSSVRLR